MLNIAALPLYTFCAVKLEHVVVEPVRAHGLVPVARDLGDAARCRWASPALGSVASVLMLTCSPPARWASGSRRTGREEERAGEAVVLRAVVAVVLVRADGMASEAVVVWRCRETEACCGGEAGAARQWRHHRGQTGTVAGEGPRPVFRFLRPGQSGRDAHQDQQPPGYDVPREFRLDRRARVIGVGVSSSPALPDVTLRTRVCAAGTRSSAGAPDAAPAGGTSTGPASPGARCRGRAGLSACRRPRSSLLGRRQRSREDRRSLRGGTSSR